MVLTSSYYQNVDSSGIVPGSALTGIEMNSDAGLGVLTGVIEGCVDAVEQLLFLLILMLGWMADDG